MSHTVACSDGERKKVAMAESNHDRKEQKRAKAFIDNLPPPVPEDLVREDLLFHVGFPHFSSHPAADDVW